MRIPYQYLEELTTLQTGDIIPILRPPYNEGLATFETVSNLINPYKVYTALLTQTGTSNPIAYVLQNTIGEIVWTRNSAGVFYATLTDAFLEFQTWCNITVPSSSYTLPIAARRNSNDVCIFEYEDGVGSGLQVSIEIRVYNVPET
jgi:hypothetical protein